MEATNKSRKCVNITQTDVHFLIFFFKTFSLDIKSLKKVVYIVYYASYLTEKKMFK